MPIRIANINKADEYQASADEDVEQWKFSFIADLSGTATLEDSLTVCYKLNIQ